MRWLAAQAWPAAAWLAIVCGAALPVHASELAVLRNGFTIRHEHRVVMGETTRLFFSSDDSSFTDVPTADIASYEADPNPPSPGAREKPAHPGAAVSAADLGKAVTSASATYHLDPDLVNSVIHAESGFNSQARSAKGAQGLMQLMPGTATELGVKNPFDPLENVGGGSRYLRELLERYNFDLVKALAAYNAGPQRVEKYQGVPPFRETRAYVARIVHEYNQKKIAQERAVRSEKRATAATSKPASPRPHSTSGAASKSSAGKAQPAKPAANTATAAR